MFGKTQRTSCRIAIDTFLDEIDGGPYDIDLGLVMRDFLFCQFSLFLFDSIVVVVVVFSIKPEQLVNDTPRSSFIHFFESDPIDDTFPARYYLFYLSDYWNSLKFSRKRM